jgi:hypothetical protein
MINAAMPEWVGRPASKPARSAMPAAAAAPVA